LKNALIGFTGFVGSTLLNQKKFNFLYRSNNIHEIENQCFDFVLCAGAPAQKWLAIKEPEQDLQNIESLISHLKTIQTKMFVLISTVDVFSSSFEVDENSSIDESGLNAYGLHRRLLEKFVISHFERYLILRLPGLVGPGLKKNVIFDLLNDNNLGAIDSRGVFQFYPMVNLWHDIQTALKENLQIVHFGTEPISVSEIASHGFGIEFNNIVSETTPNYKMRSIYAGVFGGLNGYLYSRRETLLAIRAYALSETKRLVS